MARTAFQQCMSKQLKGKKGRWKSRFTAAAKKCGKASKIKAKYTRKYKKRKGRKTGRRKTARRVGSKVASKKLRITCKIR